MSKKGKNEIAISNTAPKGKGKAKKLIIIIIVILLLCAAASGAAFFFLKKNDKEIKYIKKEYKNLSIPEEMIRYTFDALPDLYVGLSTLNDEVGKMDAEIKRLEDIEEKYPRQKKIPSTERKNFERLKKTAVSAITKIEKEVETAFVMSLVEDVKGREYIKEKGPELVQAANEALTQIKGPESEIKDAKTEEPKGIFGKIKSLFKKKS